MPSIYVRPDGQPFEIPDQITPEIQAFIAQNKLQPQPPVDGVKDSLKGIVSGGIEGIARAPLIGADLVKLGMYGVNKIRPGTVSQETLDRTGSQPWIDAFRGSPEDNALKGAGLDATYEPQTATGRIIKGGTSAVTGAVATGGMGAFPGMMKSAAGGLNAAKVALTPGSVAINAAAGAGGQAAEEVTHNPLIALLTSLGIGGGGNLARTMTAPNINQTVYNATKTMKPEEWKGAQKSIGDFEAAGSNSFTLADLPELSPRLGGAAKGLSNTAGGNLLQERLGDARFNKDIPSILGRARDEIAPLGDPRELAQSLSEKGHGKIKGLVENRSTAMEGALRAAPDIAPNDLIQKSLPLWQAMTDPGNGAIGQVKAHRAAVQALMGKDAAKAEFPWLEQPQTGNVRALSQNVKGLRNIPSVSTDNPSSAIQRNQGMKAADLSEGILRKASPDFEKAMDQYKNFTENQLAPMERGLPGRVRDVTDGTGLLTQLRKVPSDRIVPELNMLGADTPQKAQLARLLSEHVNPMPNLTEAGHGAKLDRALLSPMLNDINPDMAASVGNKFNVVDQLAKTTAEHSVDRTMGLNHSKNSLSKLINPMGSISMGAGLRTSEKETGRLAELLGNPTPENLEKLRKLSEIDPRAQRVLQWISSLTGAAQSTGSKPQGE